MYFKHSKNKRRINSRGGICTDVMPCIVNTMAKPKTLAELRALCAATGINPYKTQLRQAMPVVPGMDPIDAPPVRVCGDVFDDIRTAKILESRISSEQSKYDELVNEPPQDPVETPPTE